jgi:hypothetical protein
MKRKTNLFYVDGPDSKFITFSNYTEALTGNFLSTDTKMFPDKFLCLKINNLNASTKPRFIKYLAIYYENKLAALRDKSIEKNVNQEYEILPLAYLIEAILNVCNADENGFTLDTSKFHTFEKMKEAKYKQAGDKLITYIGNITEQDYNGTYTDTICCINANEYYEGDIKFKSKNTTSELVNNCTVEDSDVLYGWKDEQMFEEYIDRGTDNIISPVYDDNENTYTYNTYLDNIEYVKLADNNEVDTFKTIVFNVIIPMFTITNINHNTNVSVLLDEVNDAGNKCIKLDSDITDSDNLKSRRDVPLGMWMYADDPNKDTFIELKRDGQLKAYPSWSLLIASQFKPFPYTLKYRKENDTRNSVMNSFNTFAETLSKVNDVLDKFNEMNINIASLENKILSLEKQIKQIGTQTSIADMEKKFLVLSNDVKDQINDFKKQLYGYVDNITWSSKYKNNN